MKSIVLVSDRASDPSGVEGPARRVVFAHQSRCERHRQTSWHGESPDRCVGVHVEPRTIRTGRRTVTCSESLLTGRTRGRIRK